MAEDDIALSLLEQVSLPGYRASIIATYNCYLPFYEQVVLRRLMSKGCAHNILLMDAKQCAAALANEDLRPRLAGRAYTLIPVSVGGSFHPKIVLQLGKSKGVLLVGSHNVTVAGFGLNDEITNAFHYEAKQGRAAVAPFRAAVEFLRSYMPAGLVDVAEAFDVAVRAAPWMGGPVPVDHPEAMVLGSSKEGSSLWDQVVANIPRPVYRALVVAPFFDPKLRFLRRLADDLRPSELVVGVDPASVEIDPDAAAMLGSARFVDVGGRAPVPRRREGSHSYLHAKVLWFDTAEGEILVTGSANASVAAYFAGPQERNAEAIVLRRSTGADSVSNTLGIHGFLEAPEVSEAAWEEVRARRDARREPERDGSRTGATLAVVVDDGFLVDGPAEPAANIRAYDEDGADCGPLQVTAVGPPAHLAAPDDVREGASILEIVDSHGHRRALVHRPARIRENFGSDTRTALRNALGTLDEDSTQIDALLKLTEKVIFDTDDVVRDPSSSPVVHSREEHDAAGGAAMNPATLALDAGGRRRAQRRRSVASGDIAVLLDALVHRLGEGLDGGAPPRPDEELNPNDVAGEGASSPPPLEPLEPPDREDMARLCRGKVNRLVRRMLAQIELAQERGPARRAVVQLAAVLSVLRALRIIEQRPEWRRKDARLLDEESLRKLFEAACPALGGDAKALLPIAITENGGEAFDEVSTAVGLMLWLAWESSVDADRAAEQEGRVGVEEGLWFGVQCLASLASFASGDARVAEVLSESVVRSARRGVDSLGWVQTHLRFVDQVVALERAPIAASLRTPPVRPGNLVVLPQKFVPRVRVAIDVYPGTKDTQVTVVDLQSETGARKFLIGWLSWMDWRDDHGSRLVQVTG